MKCRAVIVAVNLPGLDSAPHLHRAVKQAAVVFRTTWFLD